MTFTGRTPKDELFRQIREAFNIWKTHKALMMTLPECAAAVVANPQEGIYA